MLGSQTNKADQLKIAFSAKTNAHLASCESPIRDIRTGNSCKRRLG